MPMAAVNNIAGRILLVINNTTSAASIKITPADIDIILFPFQDTNI